MQDFFTIPVPYKKILFKIIIIDTDGICLLFLPQASLVIIFCLTNDPIKTTRTETKNIDTNVVKTGVFGEVPYQLSLSLIVTFLNKVNGLNPIFILATKKGIFVITRSFEFTIPSE